jgi:adenosylcobinamide-GDP ribazoletransferase
MRVIRSFVIAFSTYSRIPMPQVEWSDENRKYSMCFFPLIGAVIGLLLWGWLCLCDALKVGILLKGAVGAIIPLLVTGGIHMDGFMDTSDAIASWQTRERRLEILKDTHTGAFAVIGCAGYLLLSAAVYGEMPVQAAPMLMGVFMISRSLSTLALAFFKSARPGGMMDGFARTAHRRMVSIVAAVYAVFCAMLWAVCGKWIAVGCFAATADCFAYYRHMAYKNFGGVTGDLAGWFVQITELVLAVVIVLGGKIL